jgi:hypothetical protein
MVVLRYPEDALTPWDGPDYPGRSNPTVQLPPAGEGLAGFRLGGFRGSAWGIVKARHPQAACSIVESQMAWVAQGLGWTLRPPTRRQAVTARWRPWRRQRAPVVFTDGGPGRGGEGGGTAGDREPLVPLVPPGTLMAERDPPDADSGTDEGRPPPMQ